MPRKKGIDDLGREIGDFFEGIGRSNKPKPAGKPKQVKFSSLSQSSRTRQATRNKPKNKPNRNVR